MTHKIERNKCLYPGCILKQDSRGYWYSGNQVSTYEIVTRLCHQDTSISKKTRDGWVTTLYGRVKSDPVRYGSYAGLNNWSPTFTETQLDSFLELIDEILH